MSTELHDVTAERLAVDGQRYTRNRRAIVTILGDAGRPLSLAEILSAGPDLAQSSVYRNLTVLEDAAVVRRIAGTDEYARFELAEELTEHHHHLLCSACGAVEDFTLPASVERSLDRALDRAASDAGFDVALHRLDLIGRCQRCR